MKSKEIRQAFLNFFREKKHLIISSDSIIIKDDPTLMFTNAGMNQFKDIFLGKKKYNELRIANSQKCLRVSGKHNDLEEVGLDTYHHTMFEMLGNWSFGDYFKKETIDFAWEFLTQTLNLDENRFFATYYEGDKNVKKDLDCYKIWKNYLPENHILSGKKNDNFWGMGDTGPCGPCSEIHIDLRSDKDRKKIHGAHLVNKNHPLVIELWNLVFIEFNKKNNGELLNLSNRYVDTGMGFERLCMVLQNKTSNYDTDLFQPIIKKIESLSSKKYLSGDEKIDVAMRVIADHLRAISFSIADEQLPSNTKAGYVIRRILRRAVRYGFNFLNFKEPFLHLLVNELINTMGDYYPELQRNVKIIKNVIKKEEEAFFKTLEKGSKLFDGILLKSKRENKTEISGKDAFKLYDTYGFPMDLTCLIAKEYNFTVDINEFEEEINKQKSRSKKAQNLATEDWVIVSKNGINKFTGYNKLEDKVRIIQYRKVKSKENNLYQIVFDQTPFYGESGGQIGDTGFIENKRGKIKIIDTKKLFDNTIHFTKELPENLVIEFKAKVDTKRRKLIAINHSATHLLHYSLRNILGNHISQKGSLVSDNYLSFDFSHYSKLSNSEIEKIENQVNSLIRQNITLQEFPELNKKKAIEMGAIALFGEKYDDKVRVIQFGNSIELCGGTHIKNTGEIGSFKIISESSIAAGIRRIEAYTNIKADEYIHQKLNTLKSIEIFLKLKEKKLLNGLKNLLDENKQLKKQLKKFEQQELKKIKNSLITNIKTINEVKFIQTKVQFENSQIIKDLVFQFRKEFPKMAIIIGNVYNNKVQIFLAFSDELVKKYNLNASDLIKSITKKINGGGGGQVFFASAGGSNIKGLNHAMEFILSSVKNTIKDCK